MGKMLFRLKFLMQKRYGTDPLFFALILIYLILLVLRIGFQRFHTIHTVLMVTAWIVLIFALCRVFSGNIEKRRRENEAFMRLLGRAKDANITNPFENMGSDFVTTQKKDPDKKYVKCPKCRATLRVPRQKGKHTVRCPRCDHRFQIRIFFGAKK